MARDLKTYYRKRDFHRTPEPRARRNAPVSVPLWWGELKHQTRPDYFNLRNLPERLSRLRKDPWNDY